MILRRWSYFFPIRTKWKDWWWINWVDLHCLRRGSGNRQRERAGDLLQVTAKYGDFPIILETYREVLRDFFDMPSLQEILRDIQSRKIRVASIQSRMPSPFAASLLFGYVGNFMYDGDSPLA